MYATSKKLLKDLMKGVEGETVAVTYDAGSDPAFVEDLFKAADELKLKVVISKNNSAPFAGRALEPYISVDALASLVKNSDIWIELNSNWLLYSKVYEEAITSNKTRYICLVGMTSEIADRCIGSVDIAKTIRFQDELVKITSRSRSMSYTTPNGTDVEFKNDPNRPVLAEGDVNGPGEYMLVGQVDWAPIESSINGTIVFDGSVNPPYELGKIKEPIKLDVSKGEVVGISGGKEAEIYEKWLKGLNDENMYKFAHLSYGCNEGAVLSGNVVEDERLWGILEWGLGNQSESFKALGTKAVSHSDGLTLNPTLYGDGELIIKDGKFVHKDLLSIK